jgi:hypothetical protein
MEFWPFFIVPAQGFFNALIYFHNNTTTKQPRASSSRTTEEPRSSSFFAPSVQQWDYIRRSFSRRRSTARADPITSGAACVLQEMDLRDLEDADPLASVVVAFETQEEDLQDLGEKALVVEEIDRNGATEGSRRPSDSVGMELSRTIPEASLDH